MPNHVISELIFEADKDQQRKILHSIYNSKGEIDFEILVPSPNNIWKHSCGRNHTEAFKVSHLDWAVQNWGTKWNAYGQLPLEQTVDRLILRFKTAWRPPYGWLIALFNVFKVSFTHNWLSEGEEGSHVGVFNFKETESISGSPWQERANESEDLHNHLHFLLWGCESFPEEEEETA